MLCVEYSDPEYIVESVGDIMGPVSTARHHTHKQTGMSYVEGGRGEGKGQCVLQHQIAESAHACRATPTPSPY